MGFRCKWCGWKLEETSYHPTVETMRLEREHSKNCPEKPKEEK